ncbi:PREDICTED: cytochrome [Prunus dulcis]|uniref:PREDICTED: cytochrome n=1 Tax=Prunus dulcis TaxID=3755 RepID=A0A5E4FSZ9_PRUDU|nr:PREDICTED: cytochrome [Prunus dulcis]
MGTKLLRATGPPKRPLANAHIVVLENMQKGFSKLFVVNELYVKLLEPVKCQLIWVTKELIDVLAVGVEDKFACLLRKIVSGDFSDGNMWLCFEMSYPIIGNLPGFRSNCHRFHDWVADMLSQTSSSTLQVKTLLNLSHDICIASHSKVEHLLISNFPNYVKGSRFYDVLHDLLIHGVFNVDGNLWTIQCKIASHEFNTKSLKHFISNTVNSEISNHLIPYLSKIYDKNRVINLQNVLRKFGFDNICNVAFGTDPACLDLENMHHTQSMSGLSFAKSFDDTVDICSSRFMSPLSLVWKMKRFFNIGSEKQFKQATEEII